jgi:alcohol dehydrogenase class IV
MNTINYFLSTDVSIGIGIMEKVIDFIKEFNSDVPGILYDNNLSSNEYFNKNIQIIKKEFPKTIDIANEFKGEPTYKYLEKIRSKFEGNQPDLIIAIGGGSTLDLGKGVALLLKNDVPAISLKGFPDKVNDPLPLITIPSIFGSGSEVSYNAVFIDEDEGKKLGINSRKNFPKKSLLDPMLTMSAPTSSVVSSALDTLVHCVDSFGSPKSTPISKMFSIEGFNQTYNVLLNQDLGEPQSRLSLGIGSVCGIIALMNSSDGPTNGFAYYFGVKDKIPHGLAGGIFLKEVMKWNYNNGYDQYSLLLKHNFKSLENSNRQLFKGLDNIYENYDIPTLNKFGYDNSKIADLAENSSITLSGSFSGNPILFDKSAAIEVISNLIN